MIDLSSEEERAMAGRPAWRVQAACISGTACHRCGALAGSGCKRPGPGKKATTCRERVWAMRALERSRGKPPLRDAVAPFLDALASTIGPYLGTIALWDDSVLDPAIRHGLVRLAIGPLGAPAWVVTAAGAEYAEEWRLHSRHAEL